MNIRENQFIWLQQIRQYSGKINRSIKSSHKSVNIGKRKGGVFDATVFVFDAVQSVKSTTVFVVCGEEMDLLSTVTRYEVYAREERHAWRREV